jgi:hypothetical protein
LEIWDFLIEGNNFGVRDIEFMVGIFLCIGESMGWWGVWEK